MADPPDYGLSTVERNLPSRPVPLVLCVHFRTNARTDLQVEPRLALFMILAEFPEHQFEFVGSSRAEPPAFLSVNRKLGCRQSVRTFKAVAPLAPMSPVAHDVFESKRAGVAEDNLPSTPSRCSDS